MASTILDRLVVALKRIDRPGTFCAIGRVPAMLPGLEVEGLGPVGLPLSAATAKELIKRCHQAPYGKGEKTLVDTSVRRVWRMKPDRFRLANPEWETVLRGIVGNVQEELGLEGQGLESHLYDLLVYEEGGFFLPHRDGEKLDGMVATLVVVLPSSHEGGELIVRHEGQEQSIDFGGDPYHIRYAAFYADCEHEVRPLKRGHRLCLVYNLTLAKSKTGLKAPRDAEHVEAIAPLLRRWAEDEGSAEKLAILLDHQYTPEGLDWGTLKGTDRVKARVLAESARQAGCRAFLALLTLHQSGEGQEEGGGYGYRRRSWSDRYEDEDPDEEGGGKYSMVEIYETELSADRWRDPEGNPLPIGELEVEEDEVLDPDSLTRVKPEEDFRGYTGNEGSPLERWYRHAAIFVWPESRHFEIVCSRDSRGVVPELVRMVERRPHAGSKDREAHDATCRELAAAIVGRWPEQGYLRPRSDPEAQRSPAGPLLESLVALDDRRHIGEFLETAMIRDVSADPGPTIAAVAREFGWSTFQPQLEKVMKETTVRTMERNVRLLEALCTARPKKKEGWEGLCEQLAKAMMAAIESLDLKRLEPGYNEDWYPDRVDRAGVLAGLARALIASGQPGLLSEFVDHALATPKRYPLTETHVAALVDLGPWLAKHARVPIPALSGWVDAVLGQLEALTAEEPREPADFRRGADVGCKCADCAELKRFLQDPQESSHRFALNEDRRRHLRDRIGAQKLDVDHYTEERGRPYTLVCTKNKASYLAALRKYHEDRGHLATIRALRAALPG